MKTLITFLVALCTSSLATAQQPSGVKGKIVTDSREGLLRIRAVSESTDDLFHTLNYILISVKQGKSGSSSNKQSGKFSLKPHESKTLSESTIRIAKADAVKIFLLIKDDETDKLIARDSLEINGDYFSKNVSFIPESSIELSGITIDETKTRPGQMFYEAFFKKYNQIPRKVDGTVTVTELPAFGRNSRVNVTIDDQVMYSFMTKPDEEAMEFEADRALAGIIRWSAENQLRNREFKY
ncbi:hypothetical protein MVI27_00085 [Chryseobacterium salipaludis]|uniref:curli-like amyloid fiber formation chaperone CsgH n=1 Tax=Chryseobacterium TaxID=59732 RepID=UPI001FF1742A|nr:MULTISPECIES: curli-like amyloid fiber formation chaperone CsgH [Chryseobacterium]MCJ8496654.1 hypothetical protein [Chryseobacterium salipaludis]MCX3296135.1 curli-like amyloid fiber formation chaperone CsgH [Planobacterium sp. JC490]